MDLNSSQVGSQAALRATYEFGAFRADPVRRVLTRDNMPVPLTSKAFEILLWLIERRERVVAKGELISGIWTRTVVEEANLSQNVFLVRKALGESAQEPRYIVTVPGQGYCFTARISEAPAEPESVPAPVLPAPPAQPSPPSP